MARYTPPVDEDEDGQAMGESVWVVQIKRPESPAWRFRHFALTEAAAEEYLGNMPHKVAKFCSIIEYRGQWPQPLTR